jgi:hypothetical protein
MFKGPSKKQTVKDFFVATRLSATIRAKNKLHFTSVFITFLIAVYRRRGAV